MVEPSRIPLRLSLDEAVILLIGVRLLGEMVESIEINGVSHETLIPSIIEKLGQVVPDDLRKMSGEIVEDILVSNLEEFGRQAEDDEGEYPSPMYSIEATLPILMEAIKEAVSVDVVYYSMASEEIHNHRLDPYGLKQVGDLYWLVAYSHDRNERGVFRVDRIKELCRTKSSFDKPSSFRIDEFFADDPGMDR